MNFINLIVVIICFQNLYAYEYRKQYSHASKENLQILNELPNGSKVDAKTVSCNFDKHINKYDCHYSFSFNVTRSDSDCYTKYLMVLIRFERNNVTIFVEQFLNTVLTHDSNFLSANQVTGNECQLYKV